MPIVTLNDILPDARRKGRGITAFNVANMETLYSVVRAAEMEHSPLIVQVYQRLFNDDRAELIAAMTMKLAQKTDIPIALHLDHSSSLDQIRKAVEIGFTSVMIDGSALLFEENIALTSQATEIAHKAGLTIEAEIGHVPFGDGEVKLSEVSEAVEFIAKTKVDALAISIGTAHGFYKKTPKLDIQRAREIGRNVSIPLVLHGGTGVPDDQLRESIKCGIAKINIATEMQNLFVRSIADEIQKNGSKFLPVDLYFKPVEEILIKYAQKKIKALA
jgi:ketose-bisphosphate aldolase